MKRKNICDIEEDFFNASFDLRRHKRLREARPDPEVDVPKLVDYSFSGDEDEAEETDGRHDITIPYIPGLLALDLKMFDFNHRSNIKCQCICSHETRFASCKKIKHAEEKFSEKRKGETCDKSSDVFNNLNITYSKSSKTKYFPKMKIGSSIFRWFKKRRSKSSKK